MNVIIIGAGQVGRALALALSADHEVVVIDLNAERLESVRAQTDVMTFEGNGASLDVLRNARVDEANLVIACTSNDQHNILISSTAKAMNGDAFTVARVAETGYLSTWSQLRKAFNVDLMVGADDLTARSIAHLAGLKTARHVEFFCDGRVEMAELIIPEKSQLAGKRVSETALSKKVNFVAVLTKGKLEVVHGDTRLPARSRLVVVGRPDDVEEFVRDMSPPGEKHKLNRVFILGGGEIGYQTALLMQKQRIKPKLVEHQPDRAEFLARHLTDTIVLQNDATDPDFLRREGIADAQVVISALRPDDRNLLTALLALDLGADRSLSVVHNTKFESLFASSGIDTTIHPKQEVVQEILRHTRKEGVKKIAFVGHHQGEIIELELGHDSALAGRPLHESAREFPREVVVGAVTRGNRVIIPRGDTILKPADHVVLFVDVDALDALTNI